jgi:ribosomal protein S18 acetylase RimI-like enzyme
VTEPAAVEVAPIDPDEPRARHCLRQFELELDRRFADGFDPAQSISADPAELRPPAGLLLVATIGSEPVGCGALKFHGGEPTEIKRMWVAESARGSGLGRRLLSELEAHAARSESDVVHLETNESLTEAIAMYRSAGYTEVPRFSDEPYAHHWFEKRLSAT